VAYAFKTTKEFFKSKMIGVRVRNKDMLDIHKRFVHL
jgi:hypothetical protein